MLPLSLRLRNFMSYGDEPVELDFSHLHLACLAGDNGHGKSALLDAMTWALWGRSRARREDDLVRQGATDMEVELCFVAGGGRYRVLRKRTLRRGGGSAALELQAYGDGGYTSITGGTINETQARIGEIVKLSYETFINSSFLLQGRADEFTVKPPAQRKAVLGEILGLGRYDTLAEKARDRARNLAAKAMALHDSMAAVEHELLRRPALQDDLAAAQSEHRLAAADLREAELGLRAIEIERQALAAEERNLERIGNVIASLTGEIATLQARRAAAERQVREAEALLEHEPEIIAGLAELRQIRAAVEEMGSRAGQAVALERQAAELRREIERAAGELRAALKAAEAEEKKAAILARQEPTLRRQTEEHELAEARIPAIEAERAALAADMQGLRDEVTALESETRRLESEMEALRNRLKLLNERGAACPVCGKPMDEAERQRVYDEYKQEGLARSDRRKANVARIGMLKGRAAELEEKERRLVTSLSGVQALGRELGRLRQLLHTAEEAVQAAEAARAHAVALHADLDAENYAHEARARLEQAEEAIRQTGYDVTQHTALRKRADELARMEQAAADLDKARERHSAGLQTIAAADDDLARRQVELVAAEEQAAAIKGRLAGLAEVEARLAAGVIQVEEGHRRADELSRRVMAIGERLALLDMQEEGLRERRVELAALEREGGAYTELATIFGKKGIQAMLIDTALPELESRANEVLTRMSDGTMQVQFATQAQSARGDLLETLDIRLADSSGTRPYEMFSGGEAFRANFAIRIALSRLLAERAGAQLQLLVIDEGFGTQDGQGRERLVEAINTIAAEFEKIVVITHIDELKDLFSTRIDVIKGAAGSQVVVSTG